MNQNDFEGLWLFLRAAGEAMAGLGQRDFVKFPSTCLHTLPASICSIFSVTDEDISEQRGYVGSWGLPAGRRLSQDSNLGRLAPEPTLSSTSCRALD